MESSRSRKAALPLSVAWWASRQQHIYFIQPPQRDSGLVVSATASTLAPSTVEEIGRFPSWCCTCSVVSEILHIISFFTIEWCCVFAVGCRVSCQRNPAPSILSLGRRTPGPTTVDLIAIIRGVLFKRVKRRRPSTVEDCEYYSESNCGVNLPVCVSSQSRRRTAPLPPGPYERAPLSGI